VNDLPFAAGVLSLPLESVSCTHGADWRCSMRQEERSMAAPSFNDLSDVDSELFEQVTDDELALVDYYRALRPARRAALLEALVRMVEPAHQATSRLHVGRPGAHLTPCAIGLTLSPRPCKKTSTPAAAPRRSGRSAGAGRLPAKSGHGSSASTSPTYLRSATFPG
jgi:hypothetical protein